MTPIPRYWKEIQPPFWGGENEGKNEGKNER
jgi:hypothetical protein